MPDLLTELRHAAAAAGTGTIGVSIEKLNAINNERATLREQVRLLRDACEAVSIDVDFDRLHWSARQKVSDALDATARFDGKGDAKTADDKAVAESYDKWASEHKFG